MARGLPRSFTGLGAKTKHGGTRRRDAIAADEARPEELEEITKGFAG